MSYNSDSCGENATVYKDNFSDWTLSEKSLDKMLGKNSVLGRKIPPLYNGLSEKWPLAA